VDIIADILRVINGNDSARKTQIMYQANLSYKLLTKYLRQVINSRLVRFKQEDKCYVITPKGEEFLELYKEYSKHNRRVEMQLNHVRVKRKALEELCSNTK
jgi:predicted transcriptional regulator